jgi:hypothetical protein
MPIEIKPLRKITLSEEDDIIIERGHSFIVTGDDRILVADSKAANIKFFNMTGKRVSIFGRKGVGPDEFLKPLYSAYRKPFVAFMDSGRDMIFIYKRSGKDSLEFVQKFLSLNLGYDFCFIDDENFLVAGDKRDKNNRIYSLYRYNFKEDKYDFILPSEIAYGCSSLKEFKKDKSKRIAYIGYFLFFDVSGDNIYLVWKGGFEVTRINSKTREITRFGKKTINYVKPYYTPEIVKAFHQRQHRVIYKLIRTMSMVRDIFVTKANNIGVVYAGPFNKDGDLPIMLQLYTADGKFIKEVGLLNAKASHHYETYFYFKKFDNRFYIMDTETTKEFDQTYKIHEYQVEE